MNIICHQSDLINAITTVQRAISSKSTMPILSGIYLEAKENELRLVGNDLNLGIECFVDAEVKREGAIVIQSRIFGEIVRKLPSDNIEIIVDEQNHVKIMSSQSEFNIIGQPEDEYPDLPEVHEENQIIVDQLLLKEMIRQTNFAISIDESRPILTGSLLEINDSKASMVSIDGFRMAIRQSKIRAEHDHKVVIPGKTLSEIGKIISLDNKEDIKITFTDKQLLIQMDRVRIISRLLEGEFINYRQILPKEFKSKVTVNTKDLLDGIERASLVAKESKTISIKLSIKDDYLEISTNVEIGQSREKIKINLEGPDLDIGFNPKYLIDALKVMDSEEITMEMTNSVSPCIMKPIDHDNYTYLAVPVRLPY